MSILKKVCVQIKVMEKCRQAFLYLLVNDHLVINCNDSCHSCLKLIIV